MLEHSRCSSVWLFPCQNEIDHEFNGRINYKCIVKFIKSAAAGLNGQNQMQDLLIANLLQELAGEEMLLTFLYSLEFRIGQDAACFLKYLRDNAFWNTPENSPKFTNLDNHLVALMNHLSGCSRPNRSDLYRYLRLYSSRYVSLSKISLDAHIANSSTEKAISDLGIIMDRWAAASNKGIGVPDYLEIPSSVVSLPSIHLCNALILQLLSRPNVPVHIILIYLRLYIETRVHTKFPIVQTYIDAFLSSDIRNYELILENAVSSIISIPQENLTDFIIRPYVSHPDFTIEVLLSFIEGSAGCIDFQYAREAISQGNDNVPSTRSGMEACDAKSKSPGIMGHNKRKTILNGIVRAIGCSINIPGGPVRHFDISIDAFERIQGILKTFPYLETAVNGLFLDNIPVDTAIHSKHHLIAAIISSINRGMAKGNAASCSELSRTIRQLKSLDYCIFEYSRASTSNDKIHFFREFGHAIAAPEAKLFVLKRFAKHGIISPGNFENFKFFLNVEPTSYLPYLISIVSYLNLHSNAKQQLELKRMLIQIYEAFYSAFEYDLMICAEDLDLSDGRKDLYLLYASLSYYNSKHKYDKAFQIRLPDIGPEASQQIISYLNCCRSGACVNNELTRYLNALASVATSH